MGDDLRFRGRYRIPSARYVGWDYRWTGVYSVTICTWDRMRCLSEVHEGQVTLSRIGEAVAKEWLAIPRHHPHVHLDEWVLMPDHMHGILIFQKVEGEPKGPRSGSLGAVIRRFKADATKQIWWNLKRKDFDWQERFHDTIVRTPAELERIRAYIRENPARWRP